MNNMKYIFICGCSHTGTTLTWAILSSHSDIFGIQRETYIFDPRIPDSRIISFFNEQSVIAQKQGKHVVCEKSPMHLYTIGRIKNLYPDSYIIVTVRNGLDVAASLKKRTGDFESGMNLWIKDNLLMIKLREKFNFHIFRYEDLIENPSRELNKICSFCNIDYEESMLAYHKNVRDWDGVQEAYETDGYGIDAHKILRNWQIRQPIMDKRNTWKDLLTEDEVTLFIKKAGALMYRLGYRLKK